MSHSAQTLFMSHSNEGAWHKHQKTYFSDTEIAIGNHNKRADAVLGKYAFEFQDKHDMTEQEIMEKDFKFAEEDYTTVWILNMDNHALLIENTLRIDDSFVEKYISNPGRNVFYSYHENIFHKNNLEKCMPEANFYESFNDGIPTEDMFTNVLKEEVFPFILKYQQQGAGSGKTYSMVQQALELMEEGNNVILLTKVNVAKNEIREKFINNFMTKEKYKSISGDTDLTQSSKKYYKLRFNGTAVIATVDSFLYNFSDKSKFKNIYSTNFFAELAKTLPYNLAPALMYKEVPIIKSTVFVDEAQDLHKNYLELFREISKRFGAQIILIGDIWQSLYHIDNLYNEVILHHSSNVQIERIHSDDKYICRRFHNKELMLFVNKHIHENAEFKKFISFRGYAQLYQPIYDISEDHSKSSEIPEPILVEEPIKLVSFPESDGTEGSAPILDSEKYEKFEEAIFGIISSIPNTYPQDWVIITPIIKTNITIQQLAIGLDEYWHKQYPNELDANKPYVKLYSSENGQPIVITKEDNDAKTKIMSIHAVKGKTYKYAIAIGCQKETLKAFPIMMNEKALFYWSALNVAYTRAQEKMFIVEYEHESREFKYRCPNIEDFNVNDSRIISILEKNEDYIKLRDMYKNTENASSSSGVVDMNYHSLRYDSVLALCEILIQYGNYDRSDGKAKQLTVSRFDAYENGFEFISSPKVFIHKMDAYMENKRKNRKNNPLPMYDHSNYYPNAMKLIKKVCDDLEKLGKERKTATKNVYIYVNNLLKLVSTGKSFKELLILGNLLYRIKHYYTSYTYTTLCEFLEYGDNNTEQMKMVKSYMNKLHRIVNKSISNIVKETEYIGYTNTPCPFPFKSLNYPKTAYKYDMFMVPLHKQTSSNDKKPHYASMSETSEFVISYPINQSLGFLNFDAFMTERLIIYAMIRLETGQEKKIVTFIPAESADKENNVVIMTDFCGKISSEDYKYILNWVLDTCYNVNANTIVNLTDKIYKGIPQIMNHKDSLSLRQSVRVAIDIIRNDRNNVDDFYSTLLTKVRDDVDMLVNYNDMKSFIEKSIENNIKSLIAECMPEQYKDLQSNFSIYSLNALAAESIQNEISFTEVKMVEEIDPEIHISNRTQPSPIDIDSLYDRLVKELDHNGEIVETELRSNDEYKALSKSDSLKIRKKLKANGYIYENKGKRRYVKQQ